MTQKQVDKLVGVSIEYRMPKNSKHKKATQHFFDLKFHELEERCKKVSDHALKLVYAAEIVHILKNYAAYGTNRDHLLELFERIDVSEVHVAKVLSMSYSNWREYLDYVRNIATGCSKYDREVFTIVVNDYVKQRFVHADFSKIKWL